MDRVYSLQHHIPIEIAHVAAASQGLVDALKEIDSTPNEERRSALRAIAIYQRVQVERALDELTQRSGPSLAM